MEKNNHLLPRTLPENIGLSGHSLAHFRCDLKDRDIEVHAYRMLRRGKVFAEANYAPYTADQPQTVYSLSKSFTSVAVGMAISDDILRLEDRIASFFPDDLPQHPSPHLEKLCIRDLLCMATGQASEPSFAAPDYVKAFLAEPFAEAPGQVFRYNTLATYMLSACLHQKGIDLEAYLNERLFAPLGFPQGFYWQRCSRGICTAGYGLSLIPEAIACFGQLLLQEGRWQGRQIVPQSYLSEATRAHIATVNDDPDNRDRSGDWSLGYGYQFWQTRHGGYRGDGMYGQFCLVFPKYDLVLALTAFTDDLQAIIDCFDARILSELEKKALPPAPANDAPERGAPLAIDWPPLPDTGLSLDSALCDKTFKVSLPRGEDLITAPSFETLRLQRHDLGYTLQVDDLKIHVTPGENQQQTLPSFASISWPTKVIASGRVLASNHIRIRLFSLELLQKIELNLKLKPDAIELTIDDIHASKPQRLYQGHGHAI